MCTRILSVLYPSTTQLLKSKLINRVVGNCKILHQYDCSYNSKYQEHFALTEDSLFSLVQHHDLKLEKFDELFFDTPDYILLKQNNWLCRRNNQWSLKHQVSCENDVLVYEEIVDINEIMQRLHSILPGSKVPSESDRPTSYCSHCFAEFTTLRYRFFPVLSTVVDLWVDVSFFGGELNRRFYVIATIDCQPLQVVNEIQISSTLNEIYCLERPAPSKVIAYLHEIKPNLLADVRGVKEITSTCFVESNPFCSKGTKEGLDAFICYAFRPGTENFWDEGEEIDFPLVTTANE